MHRRRGNRNFNEVLLDHATLTNGKLTVTTGIGSDQKVTLTGGSWLTTCPSKTGNGDRNEVLLIGHLAQRQADRDDRHWKRRKSS